MAPNSKASIPTIYWAADQHALTWKLLEEMSKTENFKVLFGKTEPDQNTSGESKIAVCKRIGAVLLPELYAEHPTTVGERIRGKINDLQKQYIKQVKRLRQTGGGLDGESQTQSQGDGNQYLDFYIPPDGPDHDTHPTARNLWEQIEKDFPFFPSLHSILSVRPSATPPAITTGVGPSGRQTLHLQPPAPNENHVPATSDKNPPILAPPSSQPAPTRSFGTPISLNEPSATPARGPRASTLSQMAIENAKAKIKKLPQKRSFEDRILELQEKNIQANDRRELEDRLLKKRRLLMEEFKLKIWTIEEYREQIQGLNDSVKKPVDIGAPTSSSTISSSSPNPTPVHHCRATSPAWDIEDENSALPSSDDFY